MSIAEKIGRALRLLEDVERNHSPAVFTSSFGAEDMVVLDLIARDGIGIATATLDTGRLPRETLALIERVRKHYRIDVHAYHPWPDSVDAFVAEHGRNGFYDGARRSRSRAS